MQTLLKMEIHYLMINLKDKDSITSFQIHHSEENGKMKKQKLRQKPREVLLVDLVPDFLLHLMDKCCFY